MTIRSVIAVCCAVSVLAMSLGSASRAFAADTWETWPKPSPLPPGLTPKPGTDAFDSGRPGEEAGKKTEKESSSKYWWLAAGVAVVIGIAVAVGSSGGGNGGGGTTTNPGHF